MRCQRFALFFLLSVYAAFVAATYKTTRKVDTEVGTFTLDLYVSGTCQFELTPPPEWKVNLNPGGGLAMRMSPSNAANVSLNIAQTCVTDKDASLTAAVVDNLKASLAADGFRMKTERRDWCVNAALAYQSWGEKTLLTSNSPTVVITNTFAESHSYHIRDGFLHHIWFSAPTNQAAKFESVFDSTWKSYGSPFCK